ncbi:hypothetical protein [Variovorax atrisoli]|uniref:hypothetical protein n=1 Tax=Variovorax atrisoli TaxID=3394203 RepID=UPI0003676CFC|nr:hypothetical protein [Variovorax paradoxus]
MGAVPKGSFAANFQEKLGSELTQTLQEHLALTSTFTLEAADEDMQQIKMMVPSPKKNVAINRVTLYFKLRKVI